ncbi:diacylglycerol kinase [Mangrovactinospora gilvigrisea]|uniref:Diacylglycerol kinase n=1 Tax=Mangrovactinospora gilvigrisea TaxID=1428644 RepID=A0A1J7C1S0_9ACTN|nr:diacylglycerol kinase family protein [Mangrovactinospora gilvigrisea]OIV35532.1 diacylglycerol kinase [Mangrovactinospora gilvigrisea]
MRALLVANPSATTTSERSRQVLARALESRLDTLEVAATEYRGHARELARQAAEDGIDLVVALGGDGTVNEVVNGLLAEGPAAGTPGLAVVPGGSTNVFARGLGLPNDPVEAAGILLDALERGTSRRVGLGRAVIDPGTDHETDRWFTFAAGMGFDAGVVGRVERYRSAGRRSTAGLYLQQVFWQFADERRLPPEQRVRLTLSRPDQDGGGTVREDVVADGLSLAIVSNTSPWTYIGSHPVQLTPHASFDTGLDMFGLTRMSVLTTARYARQALAPNGRGPRGRHMVALHDVDEFTLTAAAPLPFQVDGDHLGPVSTARFVGVRRALRVIV